MFASFEYYLNEYGGTKIKTAEEYKYLSQKAGRYIRQYTNVVDDDSKACECDLSEYLQGINKQGNISSETIPNAYSVSYGSVDASTQSKKISEILELYLGNKYSPVGIVKVIN